MKIEAAARRLMAHPETAELGEEALRKLGGAIRHCIICGKLMPVQVEFQRKGRPQTICSEMCRRVRKQQYLRAEYYRTRRLVKLGRRLLKAMEEKEREVLP